jgi:hypothetical protein
MKDKDIEELIQKLSYNQRVNFLISYFMANDKSLNRVDAYEQALDEVCEDEKFNFYFIQTLELGPVLRN